MMIGLPTSCIRAYFTLKPNLCTGHRDKEGESVRGKKIRVNGPKFHEESGAPSPNYVLVDLEEPIPPEPEPINIAPLAIVAPDPAPSGGRTPKGYWREQGASKHTRRVARATPSVSEEAEAFFNTGLIDRLVETVISLAD